MSGASFFRSQLGTSVQEYTALPHDRATALVRNKIPDLLWFLRHAGAPQARRTEQLAASLEAALLAAVPAKGTELENLRDRVLTNEFMRAELDRDQNVYLGPFFTRVLTRSIPDVVFQPQTHREVEAALVWARQHRIGITTRGAGSTAMGGAVPNDGGLLLEMSRFDSIQVDRQDGVAVIGSGARLKSIHAKLAAQGLALKSYPSNLGGTLAGWFSAGGLGLNSFQHGPVQSQVRALSMVLPRGEHVRFHDDGRLDVLSPEAQRLTAEAAGKYLEERGYPALRLADLAQTEGQFGVILTLSVQVQPLVDLVPYFFEFESDADAVGFARWVADRAAKHGGAPTNLKYLSAGHVGGVRRVREESGPAAKPSVYLDFESESEAGRFEASLATSTKWKVRRDDAEARRWFADRFRPQQTKRLGPGYLAAEILMPAAHLVEYLERAEKLAARVGVHLETEVYFQRDGRVLALPGYLSRGPRRNFTWELLLAPILLDLAMARYGGEPYVLGRWQSPYFPHKHPKPARKALRAMKKRTDAAGMLNPGVFFAPAFRSAVAQALFRTSFPGGVRFLRGLYGSPVTAPFFRALIGARHAEATAAARSWRNGSAAAGAADADAVAMAASIARWTQESLAQAARGCVNCGECNSVCPVFDDAKIRLPQMLTHIGEGMRAGTALSGTQQLLLDLCMRCGNCQEVCQADIPHLPLYAEMQQHSGRLDTPRRERHVAVLAHLRHSEHYNREFLGVRPGGYLVRTPASLPGEVRYVLFRAENAAGPVDTCIHCGACVPVCPTNANLEFQESGDVRRITTDLNRCIGCGTCVEVCPANQQNGGRTLRVMEAPTRDFFDVFAAFESGAGGNGR